MIPIVSTMPIITKPNYSKNNMANSNNFIPVVTLHK